MKISYSFMTMVLVLAFSATLAACGGESSEEEGGNGPEMRPGENCNSCHSFKVAGTLFGAPDASASSGKSGGTINLVDAAGKSLSLSSNGAGNFYTSQSLTFPLTASVTLAGVTKTMTAKVSSGACSSCHAKTPSGGAPGRLYVGPKLPAASGTAMGVDPVGAVADADAVVVLEGNRAVNRGHARSRGGTVFSQLRHAVDVQGYGCRRCRADTDPVAERVQDQRHAGK